jgi:hypothetical protein
LAISESNCEAPSRDEFGMSRRIGTRPSSLFAGLTVIAILLLGVVPSLPSSGRALVDPVVIGAASVHGGSGAASRRCANGSRG